MATEETRRAAPEEHDEALEGLRRFFWGVVGAAIAFVLWIRFELTIYHVEPEWLSKGLWLGLILGAYFGMASFRGRRERAARGAKVFAVVLTFMMVMNAIGGLVIGALFTG